MRLATILLCASLNSFAASSIDLEKLMSAPFAAELTPGPGSRVAWVLNSLGARNIWVAEAPAYKGRPLTTYFRDDGQDIGSLHWLADGSGIVFVRGGDLEHPGSSNPNPALSATVPEQSVYVVMLAGGGARKLAEGHSAMVAGDRAYYIKAGQVWTIDFKPESKPVQVIGSRGTASELVASPSGNAFALVSSRQDHSFIGVYDLLQHELRYLDPSLDSDMHPVWAPNGKSVAFIRIPAATITPRFGPAPSSKQPWSIQVVDLANTGKSRKVFEAKPGQGSRFALDSGGTPLMWADGRLVFPWERDGWLHLYSVSTDGGEPTLLTPGEFEVEYMSLTHDRKSVVYASNQDDTDRRHIWQTGIRPGEVPRRLTTGSLIEWAPEMLENGTLAFMHSDTRLPARPAIQTSGGAPRDLAPGTIPTDYPAPLAEPQQVIVSAADGMQIHGQLFLPPAGGAQKKPGLIFFHGGSRRQMLLGRHYMYYYSNSYAMNQYLASLGYVVLSVNYRSGIGYGLNFREATNYGLAGASEYNDVIGAGLYMRGRSDVDPKRIGLWGGSYGGYLTALGLARGSDLFKAGVDFHGVHDWTKLRRGIENDPETARIAFQSSPMASVDTWRSPVLLIHGDDDRNVPFGESVRLVEALRDRKVHVEQIVYPDEVHDFLTHGHWVESYKAMADFFSRML